MSGRGGGQKHTNEKPVSQKPGRSQAGRVGALVYYVIAIPIVYLTGLGVSNGLVFHPAMAPVWAQVFEVATSLTTVEKIPLLAILLHIGITVTTFWPVVWLQALLGDENYDNFNPRSQLDHSSGVVKRLYAAHKNHLETTPVLVAAILAAHLTEFSPLLTARFSLVFVGARVLFTLAYFLNIDLLRSSMFGVSVMAGVSVIAFSVFPNLIQQVIAHLPKGASSFKDEL